MRLSTFNSVSLLIKKMSTLERALELLEFKSLEDVTANQLKNSFKRIALTAHPDKGGDYVFFDEILSAYIHLSKVIKRLSGLSRIDMFSII